MISKVEWKALLTAARDGSAEAQFAVGSWYSDGVRDARGKVIVRQDYRRAVRWLEKGALAGDIDAMNLLGICYDYGTGVRRNTHRALAWYQAAWKAGDRVCAATNIATVYRDRGDHRRAFFWYQRAADSGDGDALVELAVRYLDGRGVRKAPARAVTLLRSAARSAGITESGRDDANYFLGLCYLRGTGVPRSVSRARSKLLAANRDGDHPKAARALEQLMATPAGTAVS